MDSMDDIIKLLTSGESLSLAATITTLLVIGLYRFYRIYKKCTCNDEKK